LTHNKSNDCKALKINEKQAVNALGIIEKLEPVEYDKHSTLREHYTPETLNLTNAVFIAQLAEKIEDLKHIVEGGEIGEDGKESLRGINYNAICTYAVKGNTRVEPNSEGATGANKRATTIVQNHLLTNSATIIS
jgi:hypothetical protein